MRKHRKLIRAIAITLAVLLAGGVVVGALIGALAENTPRDRYDITAEYMADEQALRVTQRLDYNNRTGERLAGVLFYAAPNMFRRQSALMYEEGDLQAVFPDGFAPGGIDLQSVRFNGVETEYGFRDENEWYLRVACDLAPGKTGAFEFEYYLLLAGCAAFLGAGETDVRLSAFYFIPGVYDATSGEFIVNRPLAFTRWLASDAAEYDVTLSIPENCALAATGAQALAGVADGMATWRATALNVREFAASFGKRYRIAERTTDSGVKMRTLARERGANARMLEAAEKAIAQCESWFGRFPVDELEIAQTDYPLGALNFPGLIWLPTDVIKDGGESLEKQLRFCVAQQYFGLSAYTEPSADAWLSDSVCEYVARLMQEDAEGRNAFVRSINRDWVDALQLTIPGGLTVTSEAQLFDAESYDVVVRVRGAVVMHELRLAMGLEAMLDGLARFYRMGGDGRTLTEMDFVAAMDAASGRSWEEFLTDWVFNVGEYVEQEIDWYE